MRKSVTLQIKGSIKGIDSFFNQPLIPRIRVDDTLTVNGLEWQVARMELIGDENMELLLRGLVEV